MNTPLKSRRRRPKARTTEGSPESISVAEYYSKAIGRALDVLDCFTDDETTLSMVEISRMQGFPESSLFRILLTLEAHGYLVRTADGAYRLAPKLLFGKLYDRANVVREIVHPFLKQLNTRFNETASLGFLFQDRIEVIDTLESMQEIRRINTLGRVLSPHCSSIGKAITAFQERTRMDRLIRINGLSVRTEKTITDHVSLLAEYEQIRKKGYSVDREESVPGGVCFGAPIFDDRQHCLAAISLSVPAFRLTTAREEEMTRAVRETARQATTVISTQTRTRARPRDQRRAGNSAGRKR